MINSKSELANCALEGLITNVPLIRPTLTSEIISLIGISDTANAADAAKQANESGNTLSSLDDYEIVGGAFKSILTPKNERLTVTYTSGYTELPKRLKLALLNTIYYLYDNRAQSIDHIYDKNVPTIGNIGPISEMILKPLRRVI